MNRKIACSIVVGLCLLLVVPIAAAQASPQPTNSASNTTTGIRIDSDLTLVSYTYNGDGVATLTFDAGSPQAVTLTDAGGMIGGGRINQITFVVGDEGQHTVQFHVTETRRGLVGVTIGTNEVLYGVIIRSPTISPFRDSSGTVGWFAGVGIVLVSFVGAALWKLKNEGSAPIEASP